MNLHAEGCMLPRLDQYIGHVLTAGRAVSAARGVAAALRGV